jgi:hypothetical protein
MGDEFDFDSLNAGESVYDISNFLGGDSGINFESLDAGPGAVDLSGLEGIDLSNLLAENGGIDLAGLNLGPEAFDIASLLGGDTEALSRGINSKRVNLDEYERSLLGPGDFDQAAPPANIAEILTSMNPSSAENLAATDFSALYNEGLTDEQIANREKQMDFYKDKTQDFGGADVMQYFDEYDRNMTDIMRDKGGFTSQWQDVGGNKVMINDDPNGGSTATVYNPTTEKTSYLDEAQTQALIANGTLNSKGSGYVAATGGTKDIPGGGKTVVNKDGTKTVTTSDGKTFVINKDGTVTKGQDTTTTKIIDNIKKVIGGGTSTKTGDKKDSNSGMLMALLALMAMMNKGGGGKSGPSSVIPSLSADRKQLPYGAASGSKARPGAGGVNYFSPTTYTQRAAGGGMMYGGGGISDLGGYSDGGRLLRGPGDGVSDSIPATIGGKQPARLAEGEFVVPARIVSELGNGSTEAGAQKLYAMMDRVQKARRKTKNVAADTKAHKYLPA